VIYSAVGTAILQTKNAILNQIAKDVSFKSLFLKNYDLKEFARF